MGSVKNEARISADPEFSGEEQLTESLLIILHAKAGYVL